MQRRTFGYLTGLSLASAALPAGAQQPFPAIVVNAVELSGDGAIAGNNFNNGVLLAFKEINAAGGILGRRVEVIPLDIQTKPEVAQAAVRKAAAMDAYALMGPVFSDMVLAAMPEIAKARLPAFVGAEATSITAQGNPYVFRTSLAQATSMPKLARYLKDGLRVPNVAMVTVDNAFGPKTRDLTIRVQQTFGLVADGIVGPRTWNIICYPQKGPGPIPGFPYTAARAAGCAI